MIYTKSPLNTSAGGLLMCRTSLPMCPFPASFPTTDPTPCHMGNFHFTPGIPHRHQVWGRATQLLSHLSLPAKHPCFFHLVQLQPQGSLSRTHLFAPLPPFANLSGITYSVDIFWFMGQSLPQVHTVLKNKSVIIIPLSTVTGRSKQSLVSLAEICIYWWTCCCHFSL